VLSLILIITAKVASEYVRSPLVTIVALMIYPYYLLFSSSSVKVLVINFIFSLESYYTSSMQIYDMFKVAISEEQTQQMMVFLWIGLVVVSAISLLAILQKLIETKLWSLAQENEIKSENLNKEMILAMDAKDRFISMISHEIRNPLNTLKGSVDYLIQVEEDPNHMKVLRNAQLSGEILLNLLNNILDAAKLKSDKIEIHRSDTRTIDIVKKVFAVNSELLREKKLIAKAYIDKKLPQSIWIDSSRLLQVLLNLMSNAVKFTPVGGKIEIYAQWCSAQENKENLLKPIVQLQHGIRTLRLEEEEDVLDIQEMSYDSRIEFDGNCDKISKYDIRTGSRRPCESRLSPERDLWELSKINIPSGNGPMKIVKGLSRYAGHLKVQVVDTGSGIAANDVPKLFGMFEQASEHSRNVHGGSGLGLWICKQICQKMNGDIALESEVGKGTSFVFYIPIHNKQESSPALAAPVQGMKKLKALVVDDFLTNRYIHQLLLEQQGVQVVTAVDGKEAVEKYKAGQEYSFILMDVNMPVMDGFTAAKRIREWETENKKKETDIYFVTGEYFDEADVLMRFKNVGGSSSGMKHLNKPLDGDTLEKIVIQYK